MPDEETAEALASLMAACEQEYGIPLTRPWPDGAIYGMARATDPHRNQRRVWDGRWVVSAMGTVPNPMAHEFDSRLGPRRAGVE